MALISLKQLNVKPYSLTNRSGTTSAAANTWTVITTLAEASSHLIIQSKATAALEIGVGAASAEVKVFELSPGKSVQIGSRDRISIRCAIASQPYTASEAVYI